MRLRLLAAGLLLAMGSAAAGAAAADPSSPLTLEAKIPLGRVSGRIDHLAIDLKRRRLFVAELGNNSLSVVDVASRKVLKTVAGFREPQGVGYEPSTDTVYVANAGDESVNVLRGEDLAPLGRIDLGSDADNVRIDAVHRRVFVGYGDGALAIIDPASRLKTGEIRLPAHPESFQLVEDGAVVAVNLPDAHRIGIVNLGGGTLRLIATGSFAANFPMTVDRSAGRIIVAFRGPPMLAAYTIPQGELAAKLPICADSDDLFVDAKRHRIYVSCGAGLVDVLAPAGDGYARLARIPTASGARTSLFVPELDRLFVAARAGWTEPAAILVFRPPS
ncbi:MAG: YncE family protein [Thiohalocapsa sp.]